MVMKVIVTAYLNQYLSLHYLVVLKGGLLSL